jgi:hypothetical protein
MATMRDRTTEDIRRDIQREREELVRAIAHLRGDIREVANVKPLLRKVAIGAAAVTAVVVAVKIVRGRRR